MLIKVHRLTGCLTEETLLSTNVWVLGECHCFRAGEESLADCVLMLQKSTAQKDERKGTSPPPIMINLFFLN